MSGALVRRLGAGVLLLVLAAVVVTGLARVRVDTDTQSVLPAGDATMGALDQRDRSFGGDPVAVLLESGGPRELLAGDKLARLLALEGRLAQAPDVAAVYGPATVLNQLAGSAQNLLAQIGGRRAGLQVEIRQRDRAAGRDEVQTRRDVAAALAQFDQHYGQLLTLGAHSGLPTLRNAAFARAVIYDDAGNPRPQWKFVVPSASSVAILIRPREGMDQEANQRLVTTVRELVDQAGLAPSRVTVSGVPAITAAATRQVRGELPLIAAVALAGCAAALLLMPWLGGRRVRRLLPLGLALLGGAVVLAAIGWSGRTVSLALIAFLPILLGCGSDFSVYLTQRVDRRTVLVTALASAVAAASLVFSPLPFSRGLGLALGAGILVTTGLAWSLTRSTPAGAEPTAGATPPAAPAPLPVRVAAAVAALAVAVIGWVGLSRLPIGADPLRLADGIPAVADAAYAQRMLGTASEVSLLVSAPDVATPAVLDWSRRAEDAVILAVGDRLRPVLTMPDLLRFLGNGATQGEIDSAMGLLPDYLTGAVVRPDHREAMMIFGAELGDLGTEQVALDRARAVLPPTPPGVTAEFVGLPVAAVRGYQLLSGGRYLGNVIGMLAAAVVLLCGLRRRSDGLRAFAAAALSAGWGLALLTVLGSSISPLTAALGSLATVTAAEFAVLQAAALRHRRPSVSRAVLAAGSAATIGYLSLLMSGLALLRQFGLLLAAVVLLSYAAARLVLWLAPPGVTSTDALPASAVSTTWCQPTPVVSSSPVRSLRVSRPGGAPKSRRYSRLNCDGLS
jgi:uncharacterized protein